eukprot:8142821-Pyramimonas_sp.AAC.1
MRRRRRRRRRTTVDKTGRTEKKWKQGAAGQPRSINVHGPDAHARHATAAKPRALASKRARHSFEL